MAVTTGAGKLAASPVALVGALVQKFAVVASAGRCCSHHGGRTVTGGGVAGAALLDDGHASRVVARPPVVGLLMQD